MAAPVTYRELLEDAAGELSGLHSLVSVPFRDPEDALKTFAALRRFAATSIRHASLLAPHDDLVQALPRLRPPQVTAFVETGAIPHPAGRAILRSRELVGAAHDLLATHLGPDRQHRTPDAALIDAIGPESSALHTVASLLVTAGVAHQSLARRAMNVLPIAGRYAGPVVRVLQEGAAVLEPAALLMDRLHWQGADPADELGRLTPATMLSTLTADTDPRAHVDHLAQVLSRLRVAAHRQGRGELPAGAGTMRALTAVAAGLIRRDLDSPDRMRRGRGETAALRAAARSWTQLHSAWGDVRTLEGGSRAVGYDAVTALRLLTDAPVAGRWVTERPNDTADWTSTLADSLSAATKRLTRNGEILVPTRWCDGLDIPRPWTTALCQHVDWLVDLHGDAATASARLGKAPHWSPSRSAHLAHPAAETVLERSS